MRLKHSMPKAAWLFPSLSAVLSAAIIMGCDSSPSLSDPNVKKDLQAQQEAISTGENKANALLNKRAGKKNVQIKSIKGKIATEGE